MLSSSVVSSNCLKHFVDGVTSIVLTQRTYMNGIVTSPIEKRCFFVIRGCDSFEHHPSNIPKHPCDEQTQQSTNGVKDKQQTNQWENRSKVTLKCTTHDRY